MMIKAIINARIYTGEEVLTGKILLIKENKIIGIMDQLPAGRPVEITDLEGQSIAPGLIDIQINGGYDRYFTQHPGAESLQDIDTACTDFGTFYYLPTLISSTEQDIVTAIHAVRDFKAQHPDTGMLGMHLEGPFFNPLKRGAHNKDLIRNPTDRELERIVQEGRDIIKVMTIAPELFSFEQIDYLQDNGIRLAAGHSNMTYEQANEYFNHGIRLVTHLFNAMSPFEHRAPGLTGAALSHTDVYTSLILDGHHCHYGAAAIADKMKDDKLFLITDSSFLGRRKAHFQYDTFDAHLENGTYRNNEGNLAGAAISMPEAIKNATDHLNIPLKQAIEMSTSRAAKAIGMEGHIGYLKENYPANFFVFNADMTTYYALSI